MKSDSTIKTFARDGDTGYICYSKDGQANFEIIVEKGYKVESIKIDGSYKNLKGPSDTGRDETYRVTKISSDLTVHVKTSKC